MNSRIRAGEAGFSLIELMIAVTLGLVILGALTTFFVQTSENRREMDRNTRQIENGRYAVDTVRDDVTLGGFYADTAPLVTPTTWTTNDACPPNDHTQFGFAIAPAYTAPVPVFGYANGTGAPLGCFQNLILNNDILVIRRFNSESLTPAEAAAAPLRWYLQNSQCAADDQTVPFKVNTGGGGFGGAPLLHAVNCVGEGRVWRLREQVYYLRSCSVCLPAPDGIPTLWRAELDPDGASTMKHVALVEGIEALRFDYGIDNTGDGQPDLWTRCDAASPCDGTAWSNVTTVKMYVLSRNLDISPNWVDNKTYAMGLSGAVPPLNDKYKRHVYTANISLPNRTGSREPQLVAAP